MSSPNVIFSDIPESVLKPGQYFEFNLSAANNSLPLNRQKVLIIGESNRGTAGGDAVLRHIFSVQDAANYHGAGSVLHVMAAAAVNANKYMDLYTYGTNITTKTARTYTLAIAVKSGTAATFDLASGLLTVKIGRQTFTMSYSDDPAHATFFDTIVDAINKSKTCPFSAEAEALTVGTGTHLILTAKTSGTILNQVAIAYSLSDAGLTSAGEQRAGVTVTGTNSVGTGDTGITSDLLATLSSNRFHKVIIPWYDSTTVNLLRDYLRNVSSAMEQRPGIGIVALAGDVSAATTLAAAVDEMRVLVFNYAACSIPAFEMAAAAGAVLASHENPNRHFDGEEIPGFSAAGLGSALLVSEQETLLANGITPVEAGPGDSVQIVRAVATQTTDSGPLDICLVTSLDYLSEAMISRMKERFKQANITDDTLRLIESEALAVLKLLEEPNMQVVQHVDDHKDEIIAERDSVTGRVNLKIPAAIVPGLHVLAGQIYVLPL